MKIIGTKQLDVDVVRLCDEAEVRLNTELPDIDGAVEPICGVDESVLSLKNNMGTIRNIFLVPWCFGLLVVFFLYWEDVYSAWKAEERSLNHFVELRERVYGDDYFINKANEVALEMYAMLDENREIPIFRYLKYHYTETANGTRTLYVDSFVGVGWLVVFSTFLTSVIRFRRPVPIFFDRDRRLVYSWRKGKVMVQRYENFDYFKTGQALRFQLRYVHENGELWWWQYAIQPGGFPFALNHYLTDLALASVVKFMEQGRGALLDRDWQGPRGIYFREDKKPEDFEEQLQTVLARIEVEEK